MLSVRHDVPVAEIISANCLDRDNLYNGETLLLPPLPEVTQPPPTDTPAPAEPTATEAVPTELPSPTELPAASATPVEIAAATLTPSPELTPSATPAASPTATATTQPTASSEPTVEPTEPENKLPVSSLALAGIVGVALGITVTVVGISILNRRQR
jgi:LysM repeat protein